MQRGGARGGGRGAGQDVRGILKSNSHTPSGGAGGQGFSGAGSVASAGSGGESVMQRALGSGNVAAVERGLFLVIYSMLSQNSLKVRGPVCVRVCLCTWAGTGV